MFFFLIFCLQLVLGSTALESKEVELKFEGIWNVNQEPTFEAVLENVVRSFLPYNPIVVAIKRNVEKEALFLARRFPKGRIIVFESSAQIFNQLLSKTSSFTNLLAFDAFVNSSDVDLDHWSSLNDLGQIDFIRLDAEALTWSMSRPFPNILRTASVIFAETDDYEEKIGDFIILKSYFENSGFKLISHWYWEGFFGKAVFIRKDIYDSIYE